MIHAIVDWIDHRTGYRAARHEALYENIPGGSRWRYVTGSMLVFAFTTQAITGVFLWMHYSAGSQNAYESVYWIQNELQGGWLLRGIHHYMAQAMVMLLPLHFLQVVLDKAYRAPREFNFWTGLILMLITLALSLTGYLLPWDQKGYWATKVATNLMTLAPGGSELQKLVVGGSDYGHYTLTRFFALHAGVLPALMVFFIGIHLSLFRRHGITAESRPDRPDEYFWPYQVFKDGMACLVLLLVVIFFVVWEDLPNVLAGRFDPAKLGAELGPPADPVEDYKAARPEWYFLFLFQLLKKFESEFFGAIVLPAIVLGFMVLMPFIGRTRFGHSVNVGLLAILIGGSVYLTGEALYEDNYALLGINEDRFKGDEEALAKYRDRYQASKDFLEAKRQAERDYERVRELVAYHGIPREGIMSLVERDPEMQGPRLFAQKCASCHSYLDPDGNGIAGPEPSEDGTPNGAPNLYQFASRDWLHGLLNPDRITSPDYFGHTVHGAMEDDSYPSGGMVEFVKMTFEDLDEEGTEALNALVVALSAEAQLTYQREEDEQAEQEGVIERGRDALVNRFACTDCHKFHDDGDLGTAPDLTGYGSLEWLKQMIANPEHERMYEVGNDRMPAFAASEDAPETNLLTDEQITLIAEWIRGDKRHLTPPQPVISANPVATTTAKETASDDADEVVDDMPAEEETAEDQPAADEPATEESVTEEPAAEELAAEEPATEEPAAQEPATEEPATEEPAAEEPATEEPATEEPAAEEPAAEEPAAEEPATEEPATEEPAAEEPAAEEPATEEPATEEPATEEPATEEPATEEPATEEPATEEPATEEPATEDDGEAPEGA